MPLGLGASAHRYSCPQLSTGVSSLPLAPWCQDAAWLPSIPGTDAERRRGCQALVHMPQGTWRWELSAFALQVVGATATGWQCRGVSGPPPIQTRGHTYVYVYGTCIWHEGCKPLGIVCLLGVLEWGRLTFPTPSPALWFHLAWGPVNDVAGQHTGFETGPDTFTPWNTWDVMKAPDSSTEVFTSPSILWEEKTHPLHLKVVKNWAESQLQLEEP